MVQIKKNNNNKKEQEVQIAKNQTLNGQPWYRNIDGTRKR